MVDNVDIVRENMIRMTTILLVEHCYQNIIGIL